MEFSLALPPVEERKKIAEILTTQNKVIELKEKRLAEKQRQKKYLMQQLLTGKKRLPGFDGKWDQKKISDISTYKASSITANSLEAYSGDEIYPVYDAIGSPCCNRCFKHFNSSSFSKAFSMAQ